MSDLKTYYANLYIDAEGEVHTTEWKDHEHTVPVGMFRIAMLQRKQIGPFVNMFIKREHQANAWDNLVSLEARETQK